MELGAASGDGEQKGVKGEKNNNKSTEEIIGLERSGASSHM